MSSSSNMITVFSSDGMNLKVSVAAAMMSELIKSSVANNKVELTEVDFNVLKEVVSYCEKHSAVPKPSAAELEVFDRAFIAVDPDKLTDIIMAADYLKIESLLDLACDALGMMIKGKLPSEVRDLLGIENEYTEEELKEQEKEREIWPEEFK